MPEQPHIIIFNPDQWRGDVMGHLGNPAAVTPNLDRIIESDAVSFRHAFCQNPVCTPSRCSFMTGWYPHVRGHRTMFHMLRTDEPVLLKQLKDAGYFVWWGGKNDLVPRQDGFADYCDVKYAAPGPLRPNLHSADDWRGDPEGDNYYSFYAGKLPNTPLGPPDESGGSVGDEVYYDKDWAMVDGACQQIRNAPPDQPLCIYLPIGYPHPPYGVEDPWYSQIDRQAIPARLPCPDWDKKPTLLGGIYARQGMQDWSEERLTELRATYYGMCARVDAQFGRLVAALKESGLYDDSAIFFFSDHGDFTGDYGLVEKTQNTFEDCLTRVPLIVKPPAHAPIQPGIRDQLVELIDFTATAYDWAGIDPGYDHFGRSLAGLIAGDESEGRDAVFCEGGRLFGEEQAKEKESPAYDDPGVLYWPRAQMQKSESGSHSKAAMCRTQKHKYVRRLYERDELYDLRADPGELHNRIDEPEYAPVLAQLRDRLLTWYQETCDVVPRETDVR
ncbi:MAG: sulfatase-like hydrolase/transferase [Chloroflexi bacterium]|nr:sulfatase-like hydrolase/transferase [Chloroflexota bacterium]